ncbi:hypothetical protein JCM5350_000454 [Sporobolomyces pararoseus]
MMASKDAHSRLIERIDRAFDRAVGYEGGQEQTLQQREQEAAERRRKRKGKARAIVPDDEEEEEEQAQPPMEEVVAAGGTSSGGGGGGFLPDPTQAGASASAGGGFFVDDSFTQPTAGAGFMTDADDGTLASFAGRGEGRFLPMETDSNENAGGGGGGFFAQEPSTNSSNDPSTSLAPSGGGFFPSTSGFDAYNPGQGLDSTLGSGGFLPQLPNLDFGGLDSLALPTPPRPARIPLSRVTGALRNLGVPRGSEREVMEMFEEVASEDENAEGGKSVRRERFIEALEVLLDDKEEDVEEEEEQEGDEEEYNDGEDRDRSPPNRRRSTRTTRRSTRANPVDDPLDEEEVPNELKETDFAELSSESEDSAEPSTEDEEDGNGKGKTPKTRKAKSSTKGKSKSKKAKYDPRSKISKDKIAAATDSFDLFFEGSAQLSLPQKDRKIGLAELQRACRVLKERFTDEDLTEMLEFAAEGNGLVDLESFARILVETGL